MVAGPYRKRADASSLADELGGRAIAATVEARDVSVLPDYMVYVGPVGDRQAARSLSSKFSARKMDSHIITSGNLTNALSLGVFSRAPLARGMREDLEKLGHTARIATITRNRSGFQVVAAVPDRVRAELLRADTPLVDCPPAFLASRQGQAVAATR